MKLLLVPNSLKELDKYVDYGINGIIVGLKDLSTNYLELTLKEIESLKNKYSDIEIFVSMNKNIFNSELDKVEESLKRLDKININGILYYDLSILYLRNKNNLKIDLVWNQTHMVTNYNTCNYYYDLGVKYGFLSTEITLEEINEIKNKTNMKLMALAYGYPVIAHSRRRLLSNYFLSKDQIYDGNICQIYDKNNSFKVKEDKTGTTFINDEIINGTCLITDSNIDYIVINNNLLNRDKSFKLVSLVSRLINTKKDRIVGEIEDLIGDNTNFFFKKTIYMVKRNEREKD